MSNIDWYPFEEDSCVLPAEDRAVTHRLQPVAEAGFDSPQPIGGPIPLNAEQEQAAHDWAADDRLWTTQDTVEFNLRAFARAILKHREGRAVTAPQEQELVCTQCGVRRAFHAELSPECAFLDVGVQVSETAESKLQALTQAIEALRGEMLADATNGWPYTSPDYWARKLAAILKEWERR